MLASRKRREIHFSTDDPWATKVFKFQSFHRLLWIREELGDYENLNTWNLENFSYPEIISWEINLPPFPESQHPSIPRPPPLSLNSTKMYVQLNIYSFNLYLQLNQSLRYCQVFSLNWTYMEKECHWPRRENVFVKDFNQLYALFIWLIKLETLKLGIILSPQIKGTRSDNVFHIKELSIRLKLTYPNPIHLCHLIV